MKNLLPIYCLLATLPSFVRAEAQGTPSSPLRQSTQLIVVTTSDWNAIDGQLQRYQRPSADSPWSPTGDPIPIVVGKKGMGWGIGIAPIDGVRNADDPVKKEGDGRSPAGIFSLGTMFGYAAQKPAGWQLPYLALTPSIECVDDPHSHYYNRLVDRSTVSPDWNSSEHMRAAGEAYRWGVVINHNSDSPRAEGGSCIFMHIWSGPGHGTVGCTAMPEQQIEAVLGWLNPAAEPLLLQMPMPAYRRMDKQLHLPSRPSLPNP